MQREIKFRGEHKGKVYKVTEILWSDGTIYIRDELAGDGNVVPRETVHLLQFTGLKDKNGKEIYEGDIVHGRGAYEEPMTWEVAWEYDPEEITGFNVGSRDDGNCQVIGNIYENPELLK